MSSGDIISFPTVEKDPPVDRKAAPLEALEKMKADVENGHVTKLMILGYDDDFETMTYRTTQITEAELLWACERFKTLLMNGEL